MKYLLNILKTKTAIIFLAALATVIGLTYFWVRARRAAEVPSLPTLSPPTIESQPLTVKPQVSKLKGKFADFPKKLPVYQISSPEAPHHQALSVARNFGFEEPPQIAQDAKYGSVYNWSSKENYLSVTADNGSIAYGLDLLNNPGILEGELAPLEEIKEAAATFLESQMISLPQNLKPTLQQTWYQQQSGPIYKPVDSAEEATVVQLDFSFEINGNTIFPPIPNISLLSLKIGPKMTIVKLDYQPPLDEFSNFETYPLKTEKKILEDIEAVPQISHLQFSSYRQFPTKEDYQKIRSIEFEEVELGYYKPPLPGNFLQPVFLISGSARLSDGQTGRVFLYLPAIEEKYFTPAP